MAPDHVSMDRMGLDHADRLSIDRMGIPQESPEDGESVHSAADTSDGASVHDNTEYVNPRGVRFMPHHQHGREGIIISLNIFTVNLQSVGTVSIYPRETVPAWPVLLYDSVRSLGSWDPVLKK